MILPVTRGDFTLFFLALNVCVLSGPTETTHCLTFLTFIKICSAKVGLWILAVPEIRLWVSLGAFPFCSMKSPFSFFFILFFSAATQVDGLVRKETAWRRGSWSPSRSRSFSMLLVVGGWAGHFKL